MINTNLILIDGIFCSGKSTTAQLLYLHLVKHGYNVQHFFESNPAHPIYDLDDVVKSWTMSVTEGKKIHEKAIANWKQLVASLKGTAQIVILESSFFQDPISSLGLMDVDREEIVDYIFQVYGIIKDLNPVLIYLYQRNIPEAFRRTYAKRSEAYWKFILDHTSISSYGKRNHVSDFTSLVASLEVSKELIDYLFSELSLPKISIDTLDDDWGKYLDQISEFLSIAPIEKIYPPFDDLSDFVGKYIETELNEEFVVTTDGKDLYLGNLPKFRLIHKADTDFYIQGMSAELSFVKDEHGLIKKIVFNDDIMDVNLVWRKV